MTDDFAQELRQVEFLTERLRAGQTALEPEFMAAFEPLADRLLVEDEAALSRLIEAVADAPLAAPRNRQLLHYFEGLVLGLNDRYPEALAVFDALLAEPDLDEQIQGRTLNSRALFCITLGRLEEALTGHRASLALWRRLGNRLREGLALLNLGILAYELRRYAEAEENLTQAARCFEEVEAPERLAAVQNEQGLVYRDLGRWEEALACFEAAAEQWQATPGDLGLAQNNIGEVLLFQGRLEAAAAAFERALELLRTETYAVDAHLHLGLVHQAAGDLPAAQTAFETALELAAGIGRADILAEVHYRLGEALRRQDQPEAALAHFEAGVAVIEANREPLRDEGLKISLLGRWQQVYEALILHYLALDRPAEAFAVAEQAQARAFADAVAANHSGAKTPYPSAEIAAAAEVQAGLSPKAALLCYFTTGVLDQDLPLLSQLEADNPVREHLLAPAQTLLFVLTQTDLTVHRCPIDPNAFASGSRRQADRTRFLTPAARRRLHTVLLAPAGPLGAIEQLYIVPHGPLHAVPFGALVNQQGEPLVRAGGAQVAFAPSATVLLHHCFRPESEAAAMRPCLAVGYDGRPGQVALRHTEAEAKFVAKFTGGRAWVGAEPKKEQLQATVERYRWLHFACHGQFKEESPLESYLETGADERLTAVEILQAWRLQAELVVLSACQTGVSRILRGDEPLGLIRAFLLAGARAALVSYWPVEDLPTFLLMQQFYRELQQTGTPGRALAAAQIWLRELDAAGAREALAGLPSGPSTKAGLAALAAYKPEEKPFAQPRHWAAFALVGKM